MKTSNILAGVFAAILMAGGTTLAADGPRDVATQANAAWDAAFKTGDAAQLAALYAEDAIVSPGNGQLVQGRDAIAGLFKGFFEAGLREHRLELLQVGGDGRRVWQVSRWQASGAGADGSALRFGGITTSVLELGSDGRWRGRSHVWNAAP